MSKDPLNGTPWDGQSQNAYAHAGNNPVNREDPTGMSYEPNDDGFDYQDEGIGSAIAFALRALCLAFCAGAIAPAASFIQAGNRFHQFTVNSQGLGNTIDELFKTMDRYRGGTAYLAWREYHGMLQLPGMVGDHLQKARERISNLEGLIRRRELTDLGDLRIAKELLRGRHRAIQGRFPYDELAARQYLQGNKGRADTVVCLTNLALAP
ncbi:MAG: hypothetical protein EXR52_05645 [Dehalococcoidia bacterium]|nr:hypothetical protein [Dehalococcoidia bacterium]